LLVVLYSDSAVGFLKEDGMDETMVYIGQIVCELDRIPDLTNLFLCVVWYIVRA
jgi:hypothetical protein